MKYGVGGINIDECRIKFSDNKPDNRVGTNKTTKSTHSIWNTKNQNEIQTYKENGRFPANTILTYDETDKEEVCGGFPDTKGNANVRHNKNDRKLYNCYSNYGDCDTRGYDDSGSASRYFYNAKASKKDREQGLEDFEERIECDRNPELKSAKVPMNRTANSKKNTHPCVKPCELMEYLVRLVTPKGGTVLDPFMGSGSTGKAIAYENKEKNANYKFIGIEKEKEYCNIAEARIKYVEKEL